VATPSLRRLGPATVRGVLIGTALLLAAATLSACADEPVTLDSPALSSADERTCNAFLDDLPRTLADHERRKVNPASALGRAWGDPAIIVRCGVGVPDGFGAASLCEVANGVGWYVDPAVISDQGMDATLTAVGYRPLVSVTVPADYRPEGAAAAIAELAQPVKDHLRLVHKCE
jgi:hypothetical protein